MATIFSKIISGEIPHFKVYEDEHVCAFLDANPMQPGHTLVVPKVEVDELFELDEEMYLALMTAARDLAQMLKKKFNCTRICAVVEGYAVPHAHIHLIPTNNADDFSPKHVHKATQEELSAAYKIITS